MPNISGISAQRRSDGAHDIAELQTRTKASRLPAPSGWPHYICVRRIQNWQTYQATHVQTLAPPTAHRSLRFHNILHFNARCLRQMQIRQLGRPSNSAMIQLGEA